MNRTLADVPVPTPAEEAWLKSHCPLCRTPVDPDGSWCPVCPECEARESGALLDDPEPTEAERAEHLRWLVEAWERREAEELAWAEAEFVCDEDLIDEQAELQWIRDMEAAGLACYGYE